MSPSSDYTASSSSSVKSFGVKRPALTPFVFWFGVYNLLREMFTSDVVLTISVEMSRFRNIIAPTQI